MSLSKPLMFSELAVEDHFISFPMDGDDSGHGGYRGAHNLFKKTSAKFRHSRTRLVDNAVNVRTGTPSNMTPRMWVVKINF